MQKDRQLLPPPWIAFPEIERYSIGWRMGYGEDYMDQWSTWFQGLTKEEQDAYQKLFPEPATWKGYWNGEDACNCYQHNEFVIELWREKGAPKYSLEQLRSACSQGKKLTYTMFWKPQPSADGCMSESCLGQWWMSDFWSVSHTFCCMEQFMMAGKAELFGDKEIREQILQCTDPGQMKALGRKVRHFEEAIWKEARYPIVLNGNYLKFTQNPQLRDYLLSTGDSILVEASPRDSIWGIRMGKTNEQAYDPMKWKGQNLLGFALMEVRDEIRRVWKHAGLCKAVENG